MSHDTENFRRYKTQLVDIFGIDPNEDHSYFRLLKQFPGNEHKVFAQILKKAGKDPPPPVPQATRPPSEYEVGENCFTKVISRKGDERWLNAKITCVNADGTFDIRVLEAEGHGVAPEAVNVSSSFLKKASEKVKVEPPPKKREEQRPVQKPQFREGDRVRVFGLRSHTAYNGLCGVVLIYVPSERRYQVRLDTNDVIAIKQRNVTAENKVTQEDDTLQTLLAKMLQENPDTDPAKLGEFAAGYLKAKKAQEGGK